jgi:hypothetical protein
MTRRPAFSVLGFLLLLVLLFATALTPAALAQGPPGPPNSTLGVKVVNTPLPITGTVTATVTPKLFFELSAPTCDVTNRCFVKFPAVPANKILRVTHIQGAFFNTTIAAFVALDLNDFNTNVFVRPLTPFPGAYLGFTLSFNEAVDVVFKAGETPIVEMGAAGPFNVNSFNRLGITGELLDIAP